MYLDLQYLYEILIILSLINVKYVDSNHLNIFSAFHLVYLKKGSIRCFGITSCITSSLKIMHKIYIYIFLVNSNFTIPDELY